MTGLNLPEAEQWIFWSSFFTYLFIATQMLLGVTGGLIALEIIGLTSALGLSLVAASLAGMIVCGLATELIGNVEAS